MSSVFISPKHAESSLRVMESYLQKQQLTDVTLIVGNKRIPAHRLVLSAGLEYFAAMFRNPLRESAQNEIELMDVDGDALWALVLYCYTGCIELQEDSVQTLLATACFLQLSPVIKACYQFFVKQLHPSNCLGIRMFADTQGYSELVEYAHAYTTKHFMEVTKNEEFLLLSADEVAKLLESEDLNVPSEETIFYALVTWLEHDPENRRKDASKLLGLVKLPLLSPAFIADNIESNEMFKDQRMAQELVMEALKYHLLPERRPLLQTGRTKPRKATLGMLLAIGGKNDNNDALSIDAFSLRDNAWRSLAVMSYRLEFGAVVVDKKLIIAGGVGGMDEFKTSNTVECLDLSTLTWSTLPPMNVHRQGLGVAVLGGLLYAVGGFDGRYLDKVERWDPITRQWSSICRMDIQRSTVGVAVLNDKLYAVGGRNTSICLSSVECYDPHADKWTHCARMSKRRGGVGVGVVNGCLYALGGYDAPASDPNASRFDCVERYDPKTDTWTMVAPMSVPRSRVGVCVLGDRLMAVGGYDGQQFLTLVEAYDPHLNEWEPVAPLKAGRAGPCVVVTRAMGNFYSVFTRPIRTFNIANRAEKIISREKPIPAPQYAAADKQRKLTDEVNPRFLEEHYKKNVQLDQRLKDVFVTSKDPQEIKEPKEETKESKPLPRNRYIGENKFMYEPYESTVISEGKCSLKQALTFLLQHKQDPVTHSSENIASEYKIDKKVVDDILKYFKLYVTVAVGANSPQPMTDQIQEIIDQSRMEIEKSKKIKKKEDMKKEEET